MSENKAGTAYKSKTFFFVDHVILMAMLGTTAAFVDIPTMSYLQTKVAEEYRGRVMSLGMSAVKLFAPALLLLSGFLPSETKALTIVMRSGVLALLFSLFGGRVKDNTTVMPDAAQSNQKRE